MMEKWMNGEDKKFSIIIPVFHYSKVPSESPCTPRGKNSGYRFLSLRRIVNEEGYSSQICTVDHQMCLWERDPDPVDPEGNLGGNMLQVPSLFHREAETDRLGRTGGALPEEIRPEEPEVGLGIVPLKGAKASGIQGGGRRRLHSPPWSPDPLAFFFAAREIIKNFTAEHAETAEQTNWNAGILE